MRPFLFCFSGLALALSLASCTSLSLRAKRVVEQSRQARPDWLHTANPVWQINQPPFELVSTKERVLNITLGLDQAYLSAVSEMRLKVQDFLQQYWNEQAGLEGLSAEDRSLFDRQVQRLVEARVDGSVVQDIYFEKLFMPDAETTLQETYTVYVQLRFDASQMALLLKDMQAVCAASPKQGWQKFAKNAQAFPIETLQKHSPQSDLVESDDPANSPE